MTVGHYKAMLLASIAAMEALYGRWDGQQFVEPGNGEHQRLHP